MLAVALIGLIVYAILSSQSGPKPVASVQQQFGCANPEMTSQTHFHVHLAIYVGGGPDTGQPDPLQVPRGSEALFVLQHLRDEAHRFAIAYHRKKRARRALASPLDDVPGIGPTRKRALLRRFGSLTRLRRATTEEIETTPGIGPEMARTIHETLHAVSPTESVG